MQVVVCALALDVARLAGQFAGCGMNPLAVGGQEPRHRVLRQPVDLQPWVQPAQFIGDGLVPAGVPEPDRGRDIQRTLGAAADAAVPALGRRRCVGFECRNELADQQVYLDGVASVRRVT